MRMFLQFKHFFIYVVGGLLSAAIDVLLLQVMLTVGCVTSIAVAVGFAGGLLVNYIYHSLLTFKVEFSIKQLFRYLVVVFFNYFLTLAFIYVADSILGVGVLAGKIMSLPVIAVNGFLLGKYWIFK
jgi:putative flippase GtrA